MDAFLMLGQSNMAGRGRLEDVPVLQNPDLFMLRNGRWQPLHEPVNPDRPQAGIGPAPSFADAYARATGRQAGLIPCADGGSGLIDWIEGGQLFEHAVCQTLLAKKISRVMGILWHQGENDSMYAAASAAYETRLCRILDALCHRSDLGEIPVLLGGLGAHLAHYPNDRYLHWKQVDSALQDIARHRRLFAYVSAEGLDADEDGLHFCAASQRRFGLRYFDSWKQIGAESPVADEAGCK